MDEPANGTKKLERDAIKRMIFRPCSSPWEEEVGVDRNFDIELPPPPGQRGPVGNVS